MSAPTHGFTEQERRRRLAALMDAGDTRRGFLKKAAAAGLIPVLSSATVAERAAAAAQDAQPVQGGTFVTLGHEEVESLSPEDAGSTVQWVVVAQLFDALYNVNEQYELEPVLAESYEPSADGRTYTFRLREGVTFHNGDPFTPADVKYTYDWIMNPDNASARAGSFELVESVEAPDPTTIVVTLTEPDVTFMVNVAPTMIYPATYHEETGENDFKGSPVGTGPFTVVDWNPQARTLLQANEEYFRGRPHFDQFQLDVVPEAAGRMAALETGQADNSVWSLNAEDNITLQESGDFTTFVTLNIAVNHFPLNNTHPVLSDRAVRQAMLHAIDRDAIINDLFLGQAEPATSNLSPAVEQFYNPDVPVYPYDVEAANALLDEAGWVMGDDGIRTRDGQALSFTCVTIQGDTQRRPEAEVVQQWVREIGVDMQLQEATVDTILAAMVAGDMDAALFNWPYGGDAGEPDARDTLSSDGANNFSNFRNEEVDQLLLEGITELDQARRVEIYGRIQEIVATEVPFLYIMHLQGYAFYNNRIRGLPESVLRSDYLYLRMHEFWKVEE